jgi:hypothetical protein
VDLDVTGQLLIIYSAFIKSLRKNGNTMRQCPLFMDFKKAHVSTSMEVLHNTLIGFGIPTKPVRLINVSK